jgi:hypothetical protein
MIAPFVITDPGKFRGPGHTVFGKNDGDRLRKQNLRRPPLGI